ncbi:MAG: hypothetical protein A2Y17_06265 [Clostridiales bacterium GWF2_38_85]|nr:MAG: hypothetical protein A2Y17_06265 [Clostridiales bacterium GWF2_38_85]
MPKGGVSPDADLRSDICSDISALIDRYSDMVYHLCIINMKHQYDAEDAYQDVFLKLHLKLNNKDDTDPFENEEHIKAWLIRVTINQCKTMKNTASRRNDVQLDENFISSASDPYHAGIADYILELPDKYHQVIYLFYYEQYSTNEIADMLSRSDGAIRTALTRARKLIKKILERRSKDET